MHRFSPVDGLHIVLDWAERGRPFRTTTAHHYQNTVTSITVPEDFRTDFASVPWFFRLFFPQVGPYSRAALFHDALYHRGDVTRVQADAIFLGIMEHDNVAAWQRWPMFLAVRCFGWIPWREIQAKKRGVRPCNKVKRSSRRALLIALAVIALSLMLAHLASGQSCPTCPVVRASHPGIVRIVAPASDGTNMGSGAHVMTDQTRSYTITNWHVVKGCSAPTVVTQRCRRLAGQVVAYDAAHDLAIIATDHLQTPPMMVAIEKPAGQLRVAGYGAPNDSYRESDGAVVNFRTPQGATEPSVVIGTPVRQGDSGGPVINARGQLVAVLWGTAEGQTYATHGRPLKRILDRIRYRWPAPGMVQVNPPSAPTARPPVGDRDGLAPQPTAPPASCNCGDQWAKQIATNKELTDSIAALRQMIAQQSETASAESKSLLGRAVDAARDKARSEVRSRLSSIDLSEKAKGVGWVVAGSLGLGGPLAFVAALAMGRLGRRLERRIDERLGRRGQEVRGSDGFQRAA